MTGLQLPALTAWRRRGDTRTPDDLWRAACWEAATRDSESPDRIRTCFAKAEGAVEHDPEALSLIRAEIARSAPPARARIGAPIAHRGRREARWLIPR